MYSYVLAFCAILTSNLVVSDRLITYKLPITPGLKKAFGYPKDTYLDFVQRAEDHGYPAQEHAVVTEDGYILKLFRINAPNCTNFRTPPIILMHGFLLSADAFLDAGHKAGLAYLLANHCYDVWVGNFRGTYYGRNHVKLNPDKDAEFWKFSIDEMGLYDVPGIIDYVREATYSSKVTYLGYSQGGAAILATFSERPEYNEKVKLYVGLAPAPRVKYTRSILFRLIPRLFQMFQRELAAVGAQEATFRKSMLESTLEFMCQKGNLLSTFLCSTLIAIFDSYDPGSLDDKTLKVLFSHFPAGASVQLYVKFAQLSESDTFIKYDYGAKKNLKIYGQKKSPSFNLNNTLVPTLLFTGLNDRIVDIRDVRWLSSQLPNVLEVYVVKSPFWNHFDVLYSRYIPELLFPKLNEYLMKFSRWKT